jgi:hypothetical protein
VLRSCLVSEHLLVPIALPATGQLGKVLHKLGSIWKPRVAFSLSKLRLTFRA